MTAQRPSDRASPGSLQSGGITLLVGDIEFDFGSGNVCRGGRALRLTPTESRLLEVLICDAGRVFSREELIALVWSHGKVDSRTVDVHIGRLRKALTRGRLLDPIESVISFGYRFRDDFAEQQTHWNRVRKRKVRLKSSEPAPR